MITWCSYTVTFHCFLITLAFTKLSAQLGTLSSPPPQPPQLRYNGFQLSAFQRSGPFGGQHCCTICSYIWRELKGAGIFQDYLYSVYLFLAQMRFRETWLSLLLFLILPEDELVTSVLVAWLCLTLCDPCTPPASSVHGIPGKNTAVDCHALLREIFLTQGSNLGLPHCRQILYHLSHQRSPSW